MPSSIPEIELPTSADQACKPASLAGAAAAAGAVQAALLPPEAVQLSGCRRVELVLVQLRARPPQVELLLVPLRGQAPLEAEPRHPPVATLARNEAHHVQQLRPEC